MSMLAGLADPPPSPAAAPPDDPQAAPGGSSGLWSLADFAAVAALALIATIPRTFNLLAWDPFIDEAAWIDWALRQVELGSPRTLLIPLLTDGRPPLFVWTIVPIGALVDNGIVAGRLAAALAGVLSTIALYGLGREIGSRSLGLIAAILWALSPFTVFLSRIAADDPLLTLLAIVSIWASIRLARRPTIGSGALCGLVLALAVLAKTIGVLLAAAPPLAIVMLGQPFQWRQYVRPLLAAFVAGLIVSAPLFPGIAPMLAQVALHTGTPEHTAPELLTGNLVVAAGWLESFVGNRFLLLAGVGLALALVMRQWAVVYVALVGAVVLGILLAVTTPLFARYLLVGIFPVYLLAAYPIERLAALIARGEGRATRRLPSLLGVARLRQAAAVLVVVLGLGLALGERADLGRDILYDPVFARIPGAEHNGYIENWYAVHGFRQVMEEIRAHARTQPVTVVVPPASRESRVLVPYALVRLYLRRDPNVRIVEAPSLWRAQDLRELERIARNGPTYLVVNGTYTPGPGMPNDVPTFTRQLERRLAQDVPTSREVLRIPRPTAPNWLSLYRLDGGN